MTKYDIKIRDGHTDTPFYMQFMRFKKLKVKIANLFVNATSQIKTFCAVPDPLINRVLDQGLFKPFIEKMKVASWEAKSGTVR